MRFTSIIKPIKYISDWGGIFLSLKEQLSSSIYNNIYKRKTLYSRSDESEKIMFYSYGYDIPLRMNSEIAEELDLFDWSVKIIGNHSPISIFK